MPSTSFDQFQKYLVGRLIVPVLRECFADSETPIGIYRKLAQSRPGTFLLESAESGVWSRYSFVGVSSYGLLTQNADYSYWIDYGMSVDRAFGRGATMPVKPIDALAALHKRWLSTEIPGLPPLTDGLVGFVGWETVRQLESLPNIPLAECAVPGQALSFVKDLVVLDHRNGTLMLIANVLADGGNTAVPEQLWTEAQHRLDQMQQLLAAPTSSRISTFDFNAKSAPKFRSKKQEYLDAIVRSKEYVVAGDVFQVVISQRFDHPVTAHPIDVYAVLRSLNPSPYMYLISLEDSTLEPYWIVGSSPEVLVRVNEGRVITHPIAGSRPRGATPEKDAAFEAALIADEKEKSEHLMLVDLARNDLSRVCRPGSVEVIEFMRVERYSHIMHLVSTVAGDVADGFSVIDVFRSTFPAGTLSGAPKPRALQIIDELEPVQRGIYGGVVGYFGFGGDADLAIAIRTATIKNGVARVQAGAGLVADSVPEDEYQESVNKAAAPLRAVAIANTMSPS